MDNREAKFILSAYRPGGQDANDPRFSEALKQVRHDPILERWFRESSEFDAAIAEKLRTVEVPAGLHENILAGAKVSRPSRTMLLKWAIAAAIILVGVVGSLVLRQSTKPHLAGWQGEALHTISSLVAGQFKFDAQSHSGADLIAWLKTNRAPAAERLPKNLETLESLGCKTFSWNGTPVSVICFMRPDGGLVHLVATVATPATDRAAKAEPTFLQQGEWTTATWREGDRIYMLALEGSPEQLRPYLS
jgi:hypothetical protein